MPTGTIPTPSRVARNFALRAVAASLGLFGLLRLPWIQSHVLLPVTLAQGQAAATLSSSSAPLPVSVTLACSGADAIALCMAAIVAYPATWRMRLSGAAAGLALILALNTVRIATLARATASPEWFTTLHLYIWPAVLTLAIGGYVFGWMRRATAPAPEAAADGPGLMLTGRFVLFAAMFLLAFLAASPFYLESPRVLALAAFVARAAAAILVGAGVSAHAAGSTLWTPRGGFLVTQECVSTPLIPIYLAAVCAYSTTWRRLTLGILAALPLFIALGIVRLLVVALPDLVSPLFFVHAFYQLLVGAVIVFLAALWRHGQRTALGHALLGIVAGVLFVNLVGPWFDRVVSFPAGAPIDDPQGAIAFLPPFQTGLYLALWVAAFVAVGWKRFLAGFAILGLTQTAGLLALRALHAHTSLVAHVRDVRGWAIVGPVLIFAAVVNGARPHR